jgi:hypothetical protein
MGLEDKTRGAALLIKYKMLGNRSKITVYSMQFVFGRGRKAWPTMASTKLCPWSGV